MDGNLSLLGKIGVGALIFLGLLLLLPLMILFVVLFYVSALVQGVAVLFGIRYQGRMLTGLYPRPHLHLQDAEKSRQTKTKQLP